MQTPRIGECPPAASQRDAHGTVSQQHRSAVSDDARTSYQGTASAMNERRQRQPMSDASNDVGALLNKISL